MKIVFLSYLHGFGGAERQNIMLANSMAERGYDVTLISICADNNCYQLDERVQYIFLPDRKSNGLRIITRYQDIKRKLKEIKPDITVNFWFQSAYLTAMMEKSITGKVIYSERGDPGDKEYSGIMGVVRKLTFPRIDGFVFQSKGAQSYFKNSVQSRSTIIPNPVFVKAKDYPEVKERRKAIVTVGRLHPQKNQKLFIDSFALISNQIPDYILEIYGDGELRDDLQKQINDLGLSDRVFLKKTSTEIHSLIYNASLFVLSSDYEGLPNSLLEAMALGIPCVSTDCRPGGAREIIQDQINGEIVRCGMRDDLARAMLGIIKNDNKMKLYSREGIVAAGRFDAKNIYAEWETYFEHIIEN